MTLGAMRRLSGVGSPEELFVCLRRRGAGENPRLGKGGGDVQLLIVHPVVGRLRLTPLIP
jgi:hypothetical protein